MNTWITGDRCKVCAAQKSFVLLALLLPAYAEAAVKQFSYLTSSSKCFTLPKYLQSKCFDKKGGNQSFEFGVIENRSDCTLLKSDGNMLECKDSVDSYGYYYAAAEFIEIKRGPSLQESDELERLRILGWQSGVGLDTCKAIEASQLVRKRISDRFSSICHEKQNAENVRRDNSVKIVILATSIALGICTIYIYIQFMNALDSL